MNRSEDRQTTFQNFSRAMAQTTRSDARVKPVERNAQPGGDGRRGLAGRAVRPRHVDTRHCRAGRPAVVVQPRPRPVDGEVRRRSSGSVDGRRRRRQRTPSERRGHAVTDQPLMPRHNSALSVTSRTYTTLHVIHYTLTPHNERQKYRQYKVK